MGRIHLVEIQDLTWFSESIRDAITDNLQFAINLTNQYSSIIPHLLKALRHSGARRIIDLCSGSGGPWLRLHRALEDDGADPVEVVLTDKYLNMDALRHAQSVSQGRIGFHTESVDAMRVPRELEGFRTFFASFHHFRPAEARAILRDAIDSGQGIGVFEVTARRPSAFLLMCFAPLWVLIFTPFIRPFRWSRILWTYVIPIVPMLGLFDGMVSCARTYSVSELSKLVEDFRDRGYAWDIGEEKVAHSPVPITYLIGYPKEKQAGPG
jgi:hypothetical protein